MKLIWGLVMICFHFVELHSQLSCPDNIVHIHSNPPKAFDPTQPFLLGTNPYTLTGIASPTVASGGLGFGPNINAATPSPTYYTIVGNTYHYWSGTTWINTGHWTTLPNLLGNLAVGPSCIYNFNSGTGGVYLYNGSTTSLLFTVPGWFSNAGVVDITTDNCCNIYILKTLVPQSLQVYTPGGILLSSCSIVGLPNSAGGGGLAIVGNYIVATLTSGAVYVGTFTGSVISFTLVAPNFGGGGGDLASCPTNCNSYCSIILPIYYKKFSCEKKYSHNSLLWETGLENNVKYYKILKSFDGIVFNTIDSLPANSVSGSYSYIDDDFTTNVTQYYKVKSVENSGKTTETNICYCDGSEQAINLSDIYPTLVSDFFYIDISSIKVNSLVVKVIDMDGKILNCFDHQIIDGVQSMQFCISNLSAGVYHIVCYLGDVLVKHQRIIKLS